MSYKGRHYQKHDGDTKCCTFSKSPFKISCFICMLFVFFVVVLYFNYDYIGGISDSKSINDPNVLTNKDVLKKPRLFFKSYLNPLTYRKIGFSTCPYTNPAYPSIGPDISYVCPINKPYRVGISWYLLKNVKPFLTDTDADNFDKFIKQIEIFRQIIKNVTNSGNDINNNFKISTKSDDALHISYQYMSCQTGNDIKSVKREWNCIMQINEYQDIFNKYGFSSWNDLEICFDQVLCMNDDYRGAVTYNLYLNENSQKLMKELIDRTEQIEENKLNIDLTFKRNNDQQSFHMTLGTILNSNDYESFDAKMLMDTINKRLKNKLPCIKLGVPPKMREKWCENTRLLKKTDTKFEWKCNPINEQPVNNCT